MKIKLLTINILPVLVFLASILSFCQSVNSENAVTITNDKSTTSEVEKPLTDEEKARIISDSQASDQAQKKAQRFLEQYPYETSRITFFCHRTASIHGGIMVARANGNYANEFIVQEYFRTDKPLTDSTISDTLMININSQINILSQLSEDIIQQKTFDDSNTREISQQIQAVINNLTEVSLKYSWSRKALLAQIEELSKIRENFIAKPSIDTGKKILSVTNKLRRLQSLTSVNGVGVRVIAEVSSLDGDINTDNLIALLSVNANGTKIRGNISTEIFGLGGRQVSNAVNISTQLSLDNALKAQESIFRIREAMITQSGLSNSKPIDLTIAPVPIPPINLDDRLCAK